MPNAASESGNFPIGPEEINVLMLEAPLASQFTDVRFKREQLRIAKPCAVTRLDESTKITR